MITSHLHRTIEPMVQVIQAEEHEVRKIRQHPLAGGRTGPHRDLGVYEVGPLSWRTPHGRTFTIPSVV